MLRSRPHLYHLPTQPQEGDSLSCRHLDDQTSKRWILSHSGRQCSRTERAWQAAAHGTYNAPAGRAMTVVQPLDRVACTAAAAQGGHCCPAVRRLWPWFWQVAGRCRAGVPQFVSAAAGSSYLKRWHLFSVRTSAAGRFVPTGHLLSCARQKGRQRREGAFPCHLKPPVASQIRLPLAPATHTIQPRLKPNAAHTWIRRSLSRSGCRQGS